MQFLKVSVAKADANVRSDLTQTAVFANDLELIADNGEHNVSNDGTKAPSSRFGTGELMKFKQ